VQLINSNFNVDEAKVIQNIPLSPLQPRDKLIWHGTSNGVFSVRSAYHMEVEWQEARKSGPSEPGREEVVWKTCWQLNIPNAVKMFLWKAGHNIIPTKTNLFRRRVVQEAMCPICLMEEETTEHILWECITAHDVWGSGPVRIQKSSCKGGNFIALLEDLSLRCTRSEVELFAIIARRIWLCRNDVVHGGGLTHPMQLLTEAVKALDDFQRVNSKHRDEEEPPQTQSIASWKPPPPPPPAEYGKNKLGCSFGSSGAGVGDRNNSKR
jgi:hypothetical protein